MTSKVIKETNSEGGIMRIQTFRDGTIVLSFETPLMPETFHTTQGVILKNSDRQMLESMMQRTNLMIDELNKEEE